MSNFESNKNNGWVCDYRSLMDWGWYKTPLTAHLFMHCVRKANRCDSYFQGTLVKRGSFITSYEKLAFETGLTVNQVRTSLDKHLLTTGELKKKATNKFTVITVVNYDIYQEKNSIVHSRQNNKQTTSRSTNKSQAETQTNHKQEPKQNTIKSQSNHNKQQYNNITRCVCHKGTHTPEKKKTTASPPVTPLGGARAGTRPQANDKGETLAVTKDLTRREWRVYCELKGHNEFEAADFWIKQKGVFDEAQKRRIREFLKANGEA